MNEKMLELCKQIIELLGEDKSMELMDILTNADLNGYENKNPENFPKEFVDMYDQAISEIY